MKGWSIYIAYFYKRGYIKPTTNWWKPTKEEREVQTLVQVNPFIEKENYCIALTFK